MSPLRVLVVDDTAVVRRLVSSALDSDPGLEVVGTAANGRLALDQVEALRPDVVTLDVEMPVMDGLEALAQIVQRWPGLPVIMFSTLTERGATATFEALALGAADYVTKPSNTGSLDESLRRVREELVPKVRVLGAQRRRRQRGAEPASQATVTAAPSTPAPRAAAAVQAVVVGVSTGGPNALAELLPLLPAGLGVPVLVVQHMPPVFTRLLAERLDAQSALTVREAAGGERPAAGEVWIAPGDSHLVVRRQGTTPALLLTDGPPENSCRPAVDVLFRAAARTYGSGLLAVVLTGMGQDGLLGSQDVRAAGGRVLVQDEASSVVWGMPGAVARAGLADVVLPLDQLAAEIARRCPPTSPASRALASAR